MSKPGRTPVEFTPMRTAISRRMVESKSKAPHFYVSTDIEMDAVVAANEALNAGRTGDDRVTLTAWLVRALAQSLAAYPALNAVWEGEALERSTPINIGIAIAIPDGLVAPALLDCATKDLTSISTELRDLVARTKSGKLRPAEFTEQTFTLSNLGSFPVTQFTAIITPPQVAILATGRSESRAVVRDGAVVARTVLTATLSADHRAVDGALVAAFLGDLKSRLEAPAGLA
ncbi:MAG: dihydrolipoamide acetyltransferase family protein [Candidatus Limnocylindrus sp.]